VSQPSRAARPVDNAADSVENDGGVWTGGPCGVRVGVDRRAPRPDLSGGSGDTPAGRPQAITGRQARRRRAVHERGPAVHGLPALPRAGPSTASTSWWRWRWD